MSQETPYIPYDIYESPAEMVILLPLGGVKKESIHLSIDNYRLVITGQRVQPKLKDTCIPLKQECYRGEIKNVIDLPSQAYFDKIHSKLTPDNILQVIIPKMSVPDKIELELE
jgi:HSP20 family molecular chaperone IbpA